MKNNFHNKKYANWSRVSCSYVPLSVSRSRPKKARKKKHFHIKQPSQKVVGEFAAFNEISAAYFTLKFIDNKYEVSNSSNSNQKNRYQRFLWWIEW